MPRLRAIVGTLLVGCLPVAAARAWTVPLEISAPSGSERSTPRIARGAVTGNLYVVYINKGSPWSVHFRQQSPPGNWGPVQQISSVFSTRPDVAEDGAGRPHVVYAATGAGGALDLVHAHRSANTWSTSFLTSTSQYEDQPHLATDSPGRIHMVFTRGSAESSAADVIYRMWDGSAWGAETIVGHVDHAYYRRPDVFIDSADNLHATWGDKVGSTFKIRYRRFNGTAWSATLDVGSGAEGSSWPGHCKVAAATTGDVLVVWEDAKIVYNYSNDGGATWAFGLSGSTQGQVLSWDRSPSLDGGSGFVHMITTLAPNNRAVGYSRWNGTSWTILGQVVWSNSFWKGWTDTAADAAGSVHAVWDEAYGDETYEHLIAYSTSAPDTVPPAPVVDFTAVAGHSIVQLSWTNPPDPDFVGTTIRYKTTGYPSGPADGMLLCERAAAPGSADAVTHAGVVNGTRYYYAAFTRDAVPNYSAAATASAVPYLPPDFDRDGDVDQQDFGHLQQCYSGAFVRQEASECRNARLDDDEDVDAEDLAVLLGCLSGKDVMADPECAG